MPLAYINIPKNKRKRKITWDKKLTTTYITGLKPQLAGGSQLAFYKSVQWFELGMTELKSCKSPERDSNLGQPDCKLDMLTTRLRCLLLPPFRSNYDVKSPDSTSTGVFV